MHLYLVRHGEARPEEEDPERPLTDRGRRDVAAVAALATRYAGIEVDRVLHSGKTRARETAEIVAQRLERAGTLEQAEDLDPNADPAVWARRLRKEEGSVMLVGHSPHLPSLASLLLETDPEREIVAFPKAALVHLERKKEGWRVRWAITPELASPRGSDPEGEPRREEVIP